MIWLGIIVAAVLLLGSLFKDAITTGAEFLNNPDARQAETLIEDLTGEPIHAREVVILRSESLTVDAPEFRTVVEEITAEIEGATAKIDGVEQPVAVPGSVLNFYRTGDPRFASADRRTTIIPLQMAGEFTDAEDNIEDFREVVEDVPVPAGFEVIQTRGGTAALENNEQSQEDLLRGESFGILIALAILLVLFAAAVAAVIPIFLAIFSIVIALGIAAIIGSIWQLSFFVFNVTAMIGLAVGIDYSLLIVSRYREERSKGLDKLDAIEKTGATANRTVLFSGMTVVFALLGMLLIPFSIFVSVAVGAILVTLVAIASALTLLPAILSVLGDRINIGRVPLISRETRADQPGGFWDRVTHIVMARPIVSLLVTAGLMIVLVIPFFDISLGFNGISTFPDDFEAKRGFVILDEEFSAGEVTPAEILLEGQVGAPRTQTAIDNLITAMGADPQGAFGVPDQIGPEDRTDRILRLTVPLNGDADSAFTLEAVERLRDDYIPAAFAGAPVEVFVGGGSAVNLDFTDVSKSAAPRVFAFVLVLSFLLLMVVFRSLVVPLKAIILNLLSVGAAYGVLVAVFQKGWGNGIFGFQKVEVIEPWIPLFLFAVLFGLSMDYHVFLLSRIRERFDQTHDNRSSVAFGLRATAKLITGAALIMVAVFGGFASGELVAFQQMGFGLAVAVLLDATIIRSVLVPSTMALLGDANWYLPKFLQWLPDLRVDGEEGPSPVQVGGGSE